MRRHITAIRKLEMADEYATAKTKIDAYIELGLMPARGSGSHRYQVGTY